MSDNSRDKITAMREGGAQLAVIREQLVHSSQPNTPFEVIEQLATQLIVDAGMKPSFSTVPGYQWTTCIMKNSDLCHGIPSGKLVENGDILTIDLGLINQGYHLDTTTTFGVGSISRKNERFLEAGRRALNKALRLVKSGQSVYQLSKVMEKTILEAGYGVVYQLTGHGVGEELHMEPAIPCVANPKDKQIILTENQTLAIEIMYTLGEPHLVVAEDTWTYTTADESLSAMFEETVLVTSTGCEVLTKSR